MRAGGMQAPALLPCASVRLCNSCVHPSRRNRRPVEFPARNSPAPALHSKVLRSLAIDLGFLRDVGRGLFLVRLAAQDRRHVALAVLAAVDNGDDVIAIPMIAGPDLDAGPMANAAMRL